MRSRRLILVILIPVALVASACWAYWHFLLRAPLAGESTHDFGEVLLANPPTRLHHIFVLSNVSGRTLELKAARADCGCLAPDFQPTSLEPGEAISIPVAFSPSPGLKQAGVLLDLGDDGTHWLAVRAIGKQPDSLSAEAAELPVALDRDSVITIIANTYGSYDPPPDLTAEAPLGVIVDVGSWKLAWRPKDPRYAATNWEAKLTIRQVDPLLSGPSPIHVHCGTMQSLSFTLRPARQDELRRPGPLRPFPVQVEMSQ